MLPDSHFFEDSISQPRKAHFPLPVGVFVHLPDLTKVKTIEYMLLLGVTLIAAVLRIYGLGKWSFWVDEMGTIRRSLAGLGSQNFFPPPQLSVILSAWSLNALGVSEWSARLVPAVIGILSIPALYFPLKKMVGSTAALLSIFFLSISSWHLFFSQSARFYTALTLFYSLAMFAFFLGFERDRLDFILLSIFFFILAFAERFMALFLLPVVAVYFAALRGFHFQKPAGMRPKNFVPLWAVLFIGMAFVVYDLYQQAVTGSSFLKSEFQWFFSSTSDDPFRLLYFSVSSIGITLVCAALIGGWAGIAVKDRAVLFLVCGAVLPLVIIILLNPVMFTNKRYLFMTLPCWTTLGALGIKEIYSQVRSHRTIVILGVLLLLLASQVDEDLKYYTINHGNRYDWKSAFAIVRDRLEEGDLVVSTRPHIGEYYLGGEVEEYFDLDEPDDIRESGRRVWFVVDWDKFRSSPEKERWIEKNSELVEVLYMRVPDDQNLKIYLYDTERQTSALQR